MAQAREALRRHPWLGDDRGVRACYVCGAGRRDGLGLHFGDVPGHPGVTAALLTADGRLLARARAVWIEPRQAL